MRTKGGFTAVLFLCALLCGLMMLATSFLGGEGQLEGAIRALARDQKGIKTFLVSAEGAANRDLDRSHLFIQLYGGTQRMMGRRVVVDMAEPDYTVARLTDGALAFQSLTATPADQSDHAQALADLRDYLARGDTPLLYVQAPQKLEDGLLPTGMENYGNENADQLLALLDGLGVDSLDLRPALREAARMPSTPPLFFRTDHHWTPEGSFLANQVLTKALGEKYGFPVDETALNEENYDITVYEDWFLGSQGKRVGSLYGGVDDISLWKPKFPTDFTYSSPAYFPDRSGPFEDSLLFPERLEPKDYFDGNPYTLYSGGDYALARMYNHLKPQGKRILLIRDSFACTLSPFLALQCGELMTMDMRYFQDDLGEYLDWLQPDAVLVMYTAASARLDQMYPFSNLLKGQ